MTSLPGFTRLELSDVAEATAAALLQQLIDAVKAGKKKVGGAEGAAGLLLWPARTYGMSARL